VTDHHDPDDAVTLAVGEDDDAALQALAQPIAQLAHGLRLMVC
jgi:hypothetical protein